MTWRQRVSDARERYSADRWRPWRRWTARVDGVYPFTHGDYLAWSSIYTCPAGEASRAYGLDEMVAVPLYQLGSQFLFRALSRAWGRSDTERLANAERLLNEIDDLALQLKRGFHAVEA